MMKKIFLTIFLSTSIFGSAFEFTQTAQAAVKDTYLSFDGTDDLVVAADSASLKQSSSFTLETWVNFRSFPASGSYVALLYKGGNAEVAGQNNNYAMLLDNNISGAGLNLSFSFENTAGTDFPVIVPVNLTLNTWYHIAGVRNVSNNTLTLYLNGTQIGQATNITASPDLGATTFGAGLLVNGFMDDIRIWNVARTASQISSSMNSELAGNESGLSAYWKMNEGSGQFNSDFTSNNNILLLGSTVNSDINDPTWIGSSGNTAPQVSISSPTSNATVSSTISITANVSDDSGVANVQFYVDSTNIGTDTSAPFVMSWNTSSVSDGNHTITALAIDNGDLTTISSGVVVLVSNTVVNPPSGNWTPPIGIPAPSFGITQQAPPIPSSWTSSRSGFYYVEQKTGCTDAHNGYPAQPRCTIPKPVPAGSVVELRGTYSTPHDGGRHLEFKGTATQPVFIRGASASSPAKVTSNKWDIEYSSYFVIENIDFDFNVPCCRGQGLAMFRDVSYGVLRNSDVSGNDYGGGINLSGVTNSPGGPSNILIYNNKISHSGQWLIGTAGYDCTPGTTWVNGTYWAGDGGKTNPTSGCDHDIHGINIGAPSFYIWILDNEIWNSSGNGVQVNAFTNNGANIRYVYMGRNLVHHNKQAGLWTKQSTDVVISQNTVHSHLIPSQGNAQAGIGGQYAPERVWVLYNHIYNNQAGIRHSTDETGNGTNWYAIGNVIHDIHNPDPAWDPNWAWSSAAISLTGETLNRYIINNVIYNVDAGIYQVRDGTNSLKIENNIIAKLTNPEAKHINIELAGTAARSYARNNIFEGNLKIKWGVARTAPDITSVSQFDSVSTRGSGNINADPRFVDPVSGNYRLQSTSPAKDSALISSVYQTFQNLYGQSIALDPDKVTRPQGSAWDIGAYEFQGNVDPAAPIISSFTASPSSISTGGSSTLSWSVSNASSLSINQGIGTVTGTSRSVSPSTTTTYTLTATGSTGLTTTSTATVTVAAAQNQPPIGFLDSVSNGVIKGWGYDPDNRNQSATICLSIDGYASANMLTCTPTRTTRPDLAAAPHNITTGTPGYEYNIPDQYKDGVSHTIYAFAVDLTDPVLATHLTGSPMSFTLGTSTNPTPGTWTPPIGIPAPSFGITQMAGAATHFVNNSIACNDANNSGRGTLSAPLCNIPLSVPAGSVVEVRGGPYSPATSQYILTGNGTASSPVFYRGINKPKITNRTMNLTGQYVVIEGFDFDNSAAARGQILISNANHVAVRNNEIHNQLHGGRAGGYAVTTSGSDVVVYNNHIHHNVYDTALTTEHDIHGVQVPQGALRVWIVDNHIEHSGGDAVQVNSTSTGTLARFIYIGRNLMHEDTENAVDIKQSEDVIISQNTVYGYTPTNFTTSGSDGTAIVINDDNIFNGLNNRVWVMFNKIYNSTSGIRTQAYASVIGNVIYNMTNAGMVSFGSHDVHFEHNTIYNAPTGVKRTGGAQSHKFDAFNNIINQTSTRDVELENASNSIFNNNLFNNPARFLWKGITYNNLATFKSALNQCSLCLEGNPNFVNAAGGNFALQSNSPAINSGSPSGIYSNFQSLYGLSIASDFNGASRPSGSAWDIGAYEFGAASTTPNPSPPPNPTPNPSPQPTPNPSPSPSPNPIPPPPAGYEVNSTKYPNGIFVKYSSDPTVYIIRDGTKHPITDWTVYQNRVPTSRFIIVIPDSVTFPTGAIVGLRSGTLIKSVNNPTVYLFDGSKRLAFTNQDDFLQLGYRFNQVYSINDDSLFASYPIENVVRSTFTRPQGTLFKYPNSATIYYLDVGTKRPFTSMFIFKAWHDRLDQVVTIGANETYPDGAVEPLPDGIVVKVQNQSTLYLIVNGTPRPINQAFMNALGISSNQYLTISQDDLNRQGTIGAEWR